MSVTTVRLQPEIEESLNAMESVTKGKVVSGEAVSTWLESWGSPNELQSPKVGQCGPNRGALWMIN